MVRPFRILFPAVAALSLCAAVALAQGPPGLTMGHAFHPLHRGPGFYLSWVKLLGCTLVFLAWARGATWVNNDCQEHRLRYQRWNPLVVGSFFGAWLLLLLLPWFWVGFPLLVIAAVVPPAAYIVHRNGQLHPTERVLTPDHLRFCLSQWLAPLGIKFAAEKPSQFDVGPPVQLTPRDCSKEEEGVRVLSARHSPGFAHARQVLADGLTRQAMAIMLDYTPETVAQRYLVDGVWLEAGVLERQAADPALECLKLLCGLKPDDRQGRQEGRFMAEYDGASEEATLVTQGVPTGEKATIQFHPRKSDFATLEDLGMRSKLQEQLDEVLARSSGLVLFSAIPGGGLRSTLTTVLRSADRITREYVSIEEENTRYEEVENVGVVTFQAAGAESHTAVLMRVFRKEPNVVIVRDLLSAEMVHVLCQQSGTDKQVLAAIRANDAAEALARVLALKAPPAELARVVTAVVNQRLVRKLCEQCKEAYQPPPEILQKLNIPAERVSAFYRPPQPNPEKKKPEVCSACRGVGYLGRTAIFELLLVDDVVRKVVEAGGKLSLLRQAARRAGMRTLQEEGLVLVAKGTTSLPELIRVLK